jgi:hypothetical protein
MIWVGSFRPLQSALREPRFDGAPHAHRDRATLDDHVAVRSENYRTANHAQADWSLHHVRGLALRASSYHGASLNTT